MNIICIPGLAEIALSNFDIYSIDTISLYPQTLEHDLILKPPKAVEYHHIVQTGSMYMCLHMFIDVYTHICVYIYTSLSLYIYIYIYMCMHINTRNCLNLKATQSS
jgi:hypothetical protein